MTPMAENEWNTFGKWLNEMLHSYPVEVTFLKKDGTERVMLCTLQPDLLPKVEIKEGKTSKKQNKDVMAVFDLEKKEWRSFTLKSVRHIRLEIGDENGEDIVCDSETEK